MIPSAALALLLALAASPADTRAPAPLPPDLAAPDTTPLAPVAMAPVAEVPPFWQTRAERTGYRTTSTYDETVEWLHRLETASPFLRVQSYGRTGEGR